MTGEPPAQAPPAEPGPWRELLRVAMPLILSSSFWTIQITVDRILLNRLPDVGPEAVGAAMQAVAIFWVPIALLQGTASYAATFVAQYVGAGRPHRVGPAVGQGLYFAVAAGAGFVAVFLPLAGPLMALGGHSPRMQELETTYFRCLCFSALPILVLAASNSFFVGRGDTWTVLAVEAVGTVVNGFLAYAWIFGAWGFPAAGIAGAGWATVTSISLTAALSTGLLFRRKFRAEFATPRLWLPDPALFVRLLRYGVPNGLHWCIEVMAFAVFLALIGRMGEAELAAASVTLTINNLAFVPLIGLGQAVSTLVGQHLGGNRPDLAARSVWTGLKFSVLYTAPMGLAYVALPGLFLAMFEAPGDHADRAAIAAVVVVLLRWVAVYVVFDGINLVFASALRGAGDTVFVSLTVLTLSWPVMVLPTWLAGKAGGVTAAWAFASVYIILVAGIFFLRFRGGRWKTMRVIEAAPPPVQGKPLVA
jgi:MATE family multidrug resistance protein